ncbi:alpha/beta fold hydrolase [Halioglobus maricola]|uniref:Alpha/beta fold hydrolase n=1 Tax=Halioglobus maricola TaxID=2601894 RepID=A0A5P9NIM8_9GAMM|nr:alpha/beta fold hydrolase [Halioglobus maricola]QFU75405.1 alpha/beta fold hydrolase [Halioglobus maricola]
MPQTVFSVPWKSETFEVLPLNIVYQEEAVFKDTYGGDVGLVALDGRYYKPEKDSDTVLISMHPIGGTGQLPVMRQLAKQGIHVIAADSRYRGVDNALIMEKVVTDLGAVVRLARETLGYKKVILLGWSGGGSLSSYYQAQAESPTVTSSPCGTGPDLTRANLIPADGVIFMAAHVSRHGTLTEWVDASIIEETDPYNRDPELDIYSGEHSAPFSAEFIARYRAAQIARNRKITAWVKDKLAWLQSSGRENEEFAFTVHATMADLRWLDPAIDPNDRKPNWCYLGDPRIVNMGPVGLARAATLRSWLSQWSFDDANGDGPRCAASITKPVLVINNTADDACTPSHAQRLFDGVGHNDKELRHIEGASHYYIGQPEQAKEASSLVLDWLKRKGFEG